MSRRIAIVEDEPAIRANYAEALRGTATRCAPTRPQADALAAFRTRLPDLALHRHRPRRRARRRLHAVPRAARAVGGAADHLPVGARLRFRHRRGPAPGRRRLPDQGRRACRISLARIARCSAAATCCASRRARRGRLERGPLALDVKRFTRDLARPAGRPHAHRVLDGARARALSRAREGPRAADARRATSSSTTAPSPRTSSASGASSWRWTRRSTPSTPVYGMGYRWQGLNAIRACAPRCVAGRAGAGRVIPLRRLRATCARWSACCATRRSALLAAPRARSRRRCTTRPRLLASCARAADDAVEMQQILQRAWQRADVAHLGRRPQNQRVLALAGT